MSSGTGILIGVPPADEDHPRQLLVGVQGDEVGRGRAHRGEPLRVLQQRVRRGAAIQSGVRSASSTSSPPPASMTALALSACSPLPIGSGTKTAGKPDAGHLGDGVRARAAEHGVGGRVGEVHPVDVAEHDVRNAGLRRRRLVAGPVTWSTWTPPSAKAGAAPRTARLIDAAPWEPPVTSSTGRSSRRPYVVRASSRSAARSRVAIIRRIGSPTYVAWRQVGVGEAGRDVLGEPRAELVGDARHGVALVDDERDAVACARRGRPAPTRSLRNRRPRRGGSGRSPRGPPGARRGAVRAAARGRRSAGGAAARWARTPAGSRPRG